MIAKAQAALAAFIVAHAQYGEIWAMNWMVIKSAQYSRHFNRFQPSLDAIHDRWVSAGKKLCGAFDNSAGLVDDAIGLRDSGKVDGEPLSDRRRRWRGGEPP
jgi:hypothetical protein